MTDNQDTNPNQKRKVTYHRLLIFFLPLAASPLLVSSTHSLINAALARMPFPELSIAVYSVVRAVTNAIKGPDIMARQVAVSMVEDRFSYAMVMKFVWGLCALILAVLLILSFTPAGGWVMRNIIGLTDEKSIAFAYSAMRITCFLPISEALRNSHQGMAIGLERTPVVSLGTAVRLVAITLFLYWAVTSAFFPGIVSAALVWTGGIALEGLVVIAALSWIYGSPPAAAEKMPANSADGLKMGDIVRFFLPLAGMRILSTVLQPVIQGGIARNLQDPTRALAAYGVAWGLVQIFAGPLRMLHQCALVYGSSADREGLLRIRRFILLVGIFLSLIVIFVALSPLGFWILRRVIAVSLPVAEAARHVLVVFALFPLVGCWREYCWGHLMERRDTRMIGMARIGNLLAVIGVFALALYPALPFPEFSPAVTGALAFVTGELVETLILHYYMTVQGLPVEAGHKEELSRT